MTWHAYYHCIQAGWNKHLTECREHYLRADVVEKIIWDWLVNLLTDEISHDEGLREMTERREAELKQKRTQFEAIAELISKAEGRIRRLASIIADTEDQALLDALTAELKLAGKQKDALVTERNALAVDLGQTEITEADREAVKAIAAQIRQKLLNKPTFEGKRHLLDLLDVRVRLQRDGDERKLFVSCGIAPEGETLPIESSSTRTSGRNRGQVIMFSATLPLPASSVKARRPRRALG